MIRSLHMAVSLSLVCGHHAMAEERPQIRAVSRASKGADDNDPMPQNSVPITGAANPALSPFDNLMVEFVGTHHIPGASLAVGEVGKVVYARGFGWANVEKEVPVNPTTSFRVASLSKPITAAAVLTLVQDGKLKLESKLVTYLDDDFRIKAHPQIAKVTIRQLLRHRAGFDREASFDPMFRAIRIGKSYGMEGPANKQQTIEYMLQRPLDFNPGAKYSYSNFGYCLLGRVIEKCSGLTYEKYVQTRVFLPLKIHSAQLARSLTAAPNESRYYTAEPDLVDGVVPGVLGQQVPRQYGGWVIENMDAHGGWIASAADMIKFASAFDSPSDLFSDELVNDAFSSDDAELEEDVFYGFGWSVRRLKSGKINAWHTGALAGTSALLVRRHDGLTWAVLFNARHGKNKKQLASLIDPLIHRAADLVDWGN